MKNQLTIIVILLSLNSALGQQDPFLYDRFMRIINKDGTDLKIKPNITSEALIRLPFWAEVETGIINSFSSMNDTINGIFGQWLIARYQGVVGYLFDGFAVEVDTNVQKNKDTRIMIEGYLCAYPNFDTALYWYGVYSKNYIDSLIKVEIEIIKLPGFEGEYISFYLRTNHTEEQKSIFLIGSSVPLKEKVVNMYTIIEDQYPFLYPGQRKHIFYNDGSRNNRINSFDLYATGTVFGIKYHYPVMENYGLHLTNKHILYWNEESNLINQDISKSFDEFWEGSLPGVYWYGDLDDDCVPDVVFNTIGGTTSSLLTLFLSKGSDAGDFLRKVDEWTSYNCY